MAITGEDVILDLEDGDDFNAMIVEAETRRAAQRPPVHPDANPPDLSEGKTYHLFVSHSEEEGEWADELVLALEQEHGLKCLWPRRDFTPGHQIADLIQSGIAASMKVLFILTPASLESGWCQYERNWAFVLSMEERENRVIPLLLEECDIPNIFKTINYIDVPKGEDHIYRILRSFDEDNDLKCIVPNLEQFQRRQVNGLSTTFDGERLHEHYWKGPAWVFSPLSDYKRYCLGKLGNQVSEKAYDQAAHTLNHTRHLKCFGITNFTGNSCAVYWCYVAVFFLFTVSWLSLMSLLYGRKVPFNMYAAIASWFLPVPIVILPIIRVLLRHIVFSRARKKIMNLSIRNVSETSILLFTKKAYSKPPTITVMHYDIKPCVNFIRDRILRIPYYQDEEDVEERKVQAQTSAVKLVLDFVRSHYDEIFTWNSLETSIVNRHPTLANKKCVCEMLDGVYGIPND